MLKNRWLKPCAQINLIMAPEVGNHEGFLKLKNNFTDKMIFQQKMEGGAFVSGSAIIFTSNSNIHTMLKETA